MYRKFLRNSAAVAVLSAVCGIANAVPTLQLGILNGVYDNGTDTGIATSTSFTLYAFLTPGNDKSATLDRPYYVSAAVVPKVVQPGATLGSFDFEGDTIDVTGEMDFGTPPLDATCDSNCNLQPHDIFETYFKEFEFFFDENDRVNSINTQNDPALSTLTANASGPTYFKTFSVDVSGLDDPTATFIHFDLYNVKVKLCADEIKATGKKECVDLITVQDFAPFSKDAQSGDDDSGQDDDVPEPGTLGLMGMALLGLGLARRRRLS